MYTVEVQFARKGHMYFVKDAAGRTVYRINDEALANRYCDQLNAKSAAAEASSPAATRESGATGWSKYSKARRNDGVSAWMADSFGLSSPTAGTNTCHFCGLDRRTCDCH